ncbi:adenylyl-sulfate kinase, partial [Salmonella enterica subsp. enterica serovar Anatum]|nr:adenylyl-sulfate kinase [Salmonella enterica subsp. enterica serovar Anatum]
MRWYAVIFRTGTPAICWEINMALHDENVVWHSHPVTVAAREQLHGHRGVVLWFTGLSG